MSFEPIAIVGRGSIFPGALGPSKLWDLVAANRSSVSECPEGRWRVPQSQVLGDGPDKAWTARGGYVADFDEVFNPNGFAISAEEIQSHDQTLRWLLHTARHALLEAGVAAPGNVPGRTGAVLGLLGLPTDSLAHYAEQCWSGAVPSLAPANRFMSGLPAHLLAKALQLDLGAFGLDAACASSIYALKLACDKLHDRCADLMLAGAVNRADDLFLHIGFTTLRAISRSGSSRPFHSGADGLLPAEGAGFVVLKRLADAEAAGNRVLAVIRGIGVSNDGRTAGLLTPSETGQEQAMRAAYHVAEVDPASLSLIECHATGTPVGDSCELRSMARVFGGLRDIPIGSIKSNLGHPITAAGMAGLFKLIGAMEHRLRPATLHVTPTTATADIAGSPFRLLFRNESWDSVHPRRAALNAFGFGGNNAHLILEEYAGPGTLSTVRAAPPPLAEAAVVSIGVLAGDATGREEFTRAVFGNPSGNVRAERVSLSLHQLGFPPVDLAAAAPQQVFALQAAIEALEGIEAEGRVGVFTGMGCDAEVARYGLRWRTQSSDPDKICPALTAPAVLGRLANIVANRISSRFNFRGPSFAVMSEEISGLMALKLAARALAAGEIDTAIVGAVDLSCEPVHEAATRAALPFDSRRSGDAAVFFVLKRLIGTPPGEVIATINAGAPEDSPGSPALRFPNSDLFGHPHAAYGMLQAAIGVLCCAHAALPSGDPWINPQSRSARVEVKSLGGASASIIVSALQGRPARPLLPDRAPRICIYSGVDRQGLLESLQLDRRTSAGAIKLTIVADDDTALARKRARAMDALQAGSDRLWADGVYHRSTPLKGELAFLFPGAAAAYKGMGKSLLTAFPELLDHLGRSFPKLVSAAAWIFAPDRRSEPDATEKLWGSSLLSQAHAHFSLKVLGLRPAAAIGVSSGETNSLAAFGVWRDLDRFYEEFTAAQVLDRVLGGRFEVSGGSHWEAWQVGLSASELEQLLQQHPALRLTGRYSPCDFAIAGEARACATALAGFDRNRARRLNYDLVVHCRDFAPYSSEWHRLHHRESFPCPRVRFYTHATGTQYHPTQSAVANALPGQALQPLDFPALIEGAWNDGIRVFLEQGPQGGCSSLIRKILGDRDHIAIPMDLATSDSLHQAAHAVAQLIAAGIAVPNASEFERFHRESHPPPGRHLTLPLHAPPVEIVPKRQAPAVVSPALPTRPLPAFEAHARELRETYARFLEAVGAGSHEEFLAMSQRALLQAAGNQPSIAPNQQEETFRHVEAKLGGSSPRQIQFDRGQLIALSSSNVSEVLGPDFRDIDAYQRVVRLPMPPLLLVDRVIALDAEPLSMGTGSIETETDVLADSWYMFSGRMPAGLMIESGQADLLLISWLGIDRHSKGSRVYRLLGCELTWHGGLPQPGDTLHYKIHIDHHARQDDIRLFFFHYDCHIGSERRLSVRNGQAGFFTDQELADSAGVLGAPEPPASLDACAKLFTRERLQAAAAGNAYACFGEGFEFAAAHQRPPGFCAPDLLLLDRVTHLGSHYLRAEMDVRPDAWFFQGHFKDDPCMPGTLMFEGCLQAMAFYMMANGMTLDKDGWRFEPVPEIAYQLKCRGQVIPRSAKLVYELFVERPSRDGTTLFADLLCTVDGLKAFHCRRMGLQLSHGFPLDLPLDKPARKSGHLSSNALVASVNGVTLDYPALLACAWGSPVDAFGPPLARFAHSGRLPRLPGPPYHFMTRITKLTGDFGVERPGASITAEFDLDPAAWYFQTSASGMMPLAALMEVALQPCGWLGSFTGIPLRSNDGLYFRNLDGSGIAGAAILSAAGTIRTHATLTGVARSGGIVLTKFNVECDLNGEAVFHMQTSFGFFLSEALVKQAGLGPAPVQPSGGVTIDLTNYPDRYFAGPLRMPSPELLMLDRVTNLQLGGDGILGYVRAEKDVRPDQWFFKAHFYQDPVQPGSLGLEAVIQALQFYVIHAGLANGIPEPVFILDGPLVWKYRGQVSPANRRVVVDLQVKEVAQTPASVSIRAEGWLTVDGLRVYHFSDFGQKVVSRAS